ncbi:MAG: bifunctional diguanylate cyclase/phosphodiesterase [Kineosporiaceae bacterium]
MSATARPYPQPPATGVAPGLAPAWVHATVTAGEDHRPGVAGPLEAALLAGVGAALAVLALTVPADAWGLASAAPSVPRSWPLAAAAALAVLGLPALRRRPPATWSRTVRALLAVGVPAAAVTLDLALAPAALVAALAVAATYPVVLRGGAGRAVSGACALACWTPAVAALVADSGLAAAADPARRTWSVVLAVAGLACLLLATVAASSGRALLATSGLAADRAGQIRRTGDELARATTLDLPTGLPNRQELLRRTTKALARADAVGGSVALVVVDLDRLDRVSDGLGPRAAHAAFDHAARRLRAARPAEDVVARVGPSTLAVLLEGVGPEGCDGLARRTVALLEEPLDAQGRPVVLPCTIGVAVASPGLDTAEELIRAAEEAREAASRSPYARWATFDVALRAHSVSQAGLELDLRDALRRGEIDLAFQPVWPMAGVLRQMLGGATSLADEQPGHGIVVEGLARWTRPDGTSVPPSRFVALAEEMGLGQTLGFQVLNRALNALVAWRAAGVAVERVAINLSRSQVEDPDFAAVVAARLAAHELSGDCLAVDVRVADLVDPERVAPTLNQLQSLGVQVVIDDLGLAGAGLAALRHVPASAVKLDRVLSSELGGDDRLVRAVAGACHDLGLQVIAEGVETGAQLRGAHDLGLHAVQGFLLARPVDARDLQVVLSLPPPPPAPCPTRPRRPSRRPPPRPGARPHRGGALARRRRHLRRHRRAPRPGAAHRPRHPWEVRP